MEPSCGSVAPIRTICCEYTPMTSHCPMLQITAASTSAPLSQEYHKYASWLFERGIRCHPSIAAHYFGPAEGWGLLATADIKRGTVLFYLPPSCLLNCPNKHLYYRTCRWTSGAELLATLMAVTHEVRLSPQHREWGAYLDVLPAVSSSPEAPPLQHPYFWPEERRCCLLQGTACEKDLGLDDIRKMHEWVSRHYFPDLSFETFLQIGALVQAYSFTLSDGSVSMIPLADLLNHRSTHHGASMVERLATSGRAPSQESPVVALEMTSVKHIGCGEQIYNTYGSHSNASLLRRYGFVDLDNLCDDVSFNSKTIQAACVEVLLMSHVSFDTYGPAVDMKQVVAAVVSAVPRTSLSLTQDDIKTLATVLLEGRAPSAMDGEHLPRRVRRALKVLQTLCSVLRSLSPLSLPRSPPSQQCLMLLSYLIDHRLAAYSPEFSHSDDARLLSAGGGANKPPSDLWSIAAATVRHSERIILYAGKEIIDRWLRASFPAPRQPLHHAGR